MWYLGSCGLWFLGDLVLVGNAILVVVICVFALSCAAVGVVICQLLGVCCFGGFADVLDG